MADAKKTRRRRWAAGIILAGLALFGIWYHIPLHRTLEVTAFKETGEPAVLQMDITLHRFFLRGTVMRGTIGLDGVSYVSVPMLEPEPNSFLDGLRDKWSGGISSSYFVEAERLAGGGDAIYLTQDSLRISGVSFRGFYDSIDGLFLVQMRPDAPSIWYAVDPLTY